MWIFFYLKKNCSFASWKGEAKEKKRKGRKRLFCCCGSGKIKTYPSRSEDTGSSAFFPLARSLYLRCRCCYPVFIYFPYLLAEYIPSCVWGLLHISSSDRHIEALRWTVVNKKNIFPSWPVRSTAGRCRINATTVTSLQCIAPRSYIIEMVFFPLLSCWTRCVREREKPHGLRHDLKTETNVHVVFFSSYFKETLERRVNKSLAPRWQIDWQYLSQHKKMLS